MMPRRLLTVLLVLLVGLVVASVVGPRPDERRADRAATTPATTTSPRTVPATTPTEPRPAAADPRPPVEGVLPGGRPVRVTTGATLDLEVRSDREAVVEIPALGAQEPASPGTPAQFVVAFDEPGSYTVRDAETRRTFGTVVVTG